MCVRTLCILCIYKYKHACVYLRKIWYVYIKYIYSNIKYKNINVYTWKYFQNIYCTFVYLYIHKYTQCTYIYYVHKTFFLDVINRWTALVWTMKKMAEQWILISRQSANHPFRTKLCVINLKNMGVVHTWVHSYRNQFKLLKKSFHLSKATFPQFLTILCDNYDSYYD